MKRIAYHREDWVEQQIENWVGYSPAGQTSSIAWTEALGVRVEVNRSSGHIPGDPDHALRTGKALDSLPIAERCALVLYHTKRSLTQSDIAHALKVRRQKVRDLLRDAHVGFCNGWDSAKFHAIHNDRHRPDCRTSATFTDNPNNEANIRTIVPPML